VAALIGLRDGTRMEASKPAAGHGHGEPSAGSPCLRRPWTHGPAKPHREWSTASNGESHGIACLSESRVTLQVYLAACHLAVCATAPLWLRPTDGQPRGPPFGPPPMLVSFTSVVDESAIRPRWRHADFSAACPARPPFVSGPNRTKEGLLDAGEGEGEMSKNLPKLLEGLMPDADARRRARALQ